MKYNFKLILTDKEIKDNRAKQIIEAKEQRQNYSMIIGGIIILIALVVIVVLDNNAGINRVKQQCASENKQAVEYYRYDGEKDYICK